MYVLDEPSIGLHAARQRAPHRHAPAPARSRQQRHRRRARRGDDPRRRPRGRLRPRRRARWAARSSSTERPTRSRRAAASPAQYLSGRRRIEVPARRRRRPSWITVKGAARAQPQGRRRALPPRRPHGRHRRQRRGQELARQRHPAPGPRARLHDAAEPVGAHDAIDGLEALDKVIAIDQQPIGRTPRSNPGTYTKAFDAIRAVFAAAPRRARARLGRGALQLQRQGRPLREVRRRRVGEGRDALPRRRVGAVRGVRHEALQRRDPRGALQGQVDRRRARVERRRVPRALLRLPAARAHPRDARGGGPRLHEGRAAGARR